MKKEEFKLITDKGIHEYTITVHEIDRGTLYELSASHEGIWSDPGETFLMALDTGNGINFTGLGGSKMDYSNFYNMALLTQFIMKWDKNLGPAVHYYQRIDL